ncbi:transposable element Tcb1 transposase [Trichonephila clavipes]|nr:transposable element Tcb1 transposase [Trichonephila clavipes]
MIPWALEEESRDHICLLIVLNGLNNRKKHQDGYIRVLWNRGERPFAECVHHRQTCSSPDVMVWDAFGYSSRSPLVFIDCTLNSARYISGALQPVALPFIRALRNRTYQHSAYCRYCTYLP